MRCLYGQDRRLQHLLRNVSKIPLGVNSVVYCETPRFCVYVLVWEGDDKKCLPNPNRWLMTMDSPSRVTFAGTACSRSHSFVFQLHGEPSFTHAGAATTLQ